MRKERTFRIISLVMVMVLFACPISALAAENKQVKKIPEINEVAEYLLENKVDYYIDRTPVAEVDTKFPEKFDLRDRGVVTPVKLQMPFGTCWGFAAIAAAETSILSELGTTYEETGLDLSEHHTAWFATQPISDGSSQDGEGVHQLDEMNPLDYGGSSISATSLFSSGIGVTFESQVPYRGLNSNTDKALFFNNYYSADDDWSIPSEYEFYQAYQLEETSIFDSPAIYDTGTDEEDFLSREEGYLGYDASVTERIKEEIYAGRPCSVGFCADTYTPAKIELGLKPQYLSTEGNDWAHYTYDGGVHNHEVTIVGWDDTFPKEKFLDHTYDEYGDGLPHRPEGDGAWIVKNSWGASINDFPGYYEWGNLDDEGQNTGYFYISYYDRSLDRPESLNFDLSGNDIGYIIDQYDFLQSIKKNVWVSSSPVQMANVFTAEHNQNLRALSCETSKGNTEVLYQVYLLDNKSSLPDSGKLVAEEYESYENAGYHRVNLSDSVYLKEGQNYAVVLTQKIQDSDKEYFEISCDQGMNEEAVLKHNNDQHRMNPNASDEELFLYHYYSKGIVNENESYLYIDEFDDWFDFSLIIPELQKSEDYEGVDFDNFSIKAYCDFTSEEEAINAFEIDEVTPLEYAPPAKDIDVKMLIIYICVALAMLAAVALIIIVIVKIAKKKKALKAYIKNLEDENRRLKGENPTDEMT